MVAVAVPVKAFKLIGEKPILGRDFLPEDDRPGAAPVVILGNGIWKTRYGSDPAVIGRTIKVNEGQYTITGVMPPGFHFPDDVDLWLRLQWDLTQHSRAAHFMEAVARLAPGVDVPRAQTESTALAGRLEKQFAATNRAWDVRLIPLIDEQLGYYRAALIVLFGAVGLLMLIGCFNVASQGLSAQPMYGGPVYFYQNLVYNAPASGALKFVAEPGSVS